MLFEIDKAKTNLYDIVQFASEEDLEELENSIDNIYEFFDYAKDYYYSSISWSVRDFEGRAEQLYGDAWKNTYDESKFDNALYEMIRKHDANIGITWDTIDCYLDEYCTRTDFDGKD